MFIFVSTAWIIGSYELYDSIVHFTSQWFWIIIAMFYTVTINEVFIHEFWAHGDPKKINVNSLTYKILIFLVTVDHAQGPLTNLCIAHKNHHMYSDKPGDSVNYRSSWHSHCILSPWIFFTSTPEIPDGKQYYDAQREKYKELLNDKWTFFVEEFRVPLTILFWAFLYFTFPIILFKIILMGRFIDSIYQLFANVFGHMKLPFSYRNFNTNDTTYNNLILHYLGLCLFPAMLHNNHHGKRTLETHKVKWYEFDPSKYTLNIFKFLMKK